jgi:hypothetical protein
MPGWLSPRSHLMPEPVPAIGSSARRIAPAGDNRLGAAIRHGSSVVQTRSRTAHKLLVVISDAFAYERAYAPRGHAPRVGGGTRGEDFGGACQLALPQLPRQRARGRGGRPGTQSIRQHADEVSRGPVVADDVGLRVEAGPARGHSAADLRARAPHDLRVVTAAIAVHVRRALHVAFVT